MKENGARQTYIAPDVKVFSCDVQDVVRVSEATPSWRWDDGNGDYFVSDIKNGGEL